MVLYDVVLVVLQYVVYDRMCVIISILVYIICPVGLVYDLVYSMFPTVHVYAVPLRSAIAVSEGSITPLS